jgi:hypothetical protein
MKDRVERGHGVGRTMPAIPSQEVLHPCCPIESVKHVQNLAARVKSGFSWLFTPLPAAIRKEPGTTAPNRALAGTCLEYWVPKD